VDEEQAAALLVLVADAVAAGFRRRPGAARRAVGHYGERTGHAATLEGHAQLLFGALLRELCSFGGYLPPADWAEEDDRPGKAVTVADVVAALRAALAGQEGASDA
jgi:hypothetical protein